MASVATPAPSAPAMPAVAPPTPATTSGGNGAEVASNIMKDFDAAFSASDAEPRSHVEAPAPEPLGDLPTETTTPTSAAPEAEAPTTEETPVIEAAPDGETKPAGSKAAETPAEYANLPEGVQLIEGKDGKKSYQIPAEHFGEFHQAYSMGLRAQEVFGQALSEEVIADLDRSRRVQFAMENDIISPDPGGMERLLGHLQRTSIDARNNGYASHDAMQILADRMPDWLERYNPQAYQTQANRVLQKVINRSYQIAQESNDADLLKATKWFEYKTFGQFRTNEDLAREAAQPRMDPRLVDLERREQAVREHETRQEGARWESETGELFGRVAKNSTDAIKNTLKPLVPHYERLQSPETVVLFQRQLEDLIGETIAKDVSWIRHRNDLLNRARATQDPGARKQLLDTVEKLVETKIKIILDPRRNAKVREILSKGAAPVKATVDASHARHAEAASRREPTGTGATPQRSVMPPAPPSKGYSKTADDIRDEIMKSL